MSNLGRLIKRIKRLVWLAPIACRLLPANTIDPAQVWTSGSVQYTWVAMYWLVNNRGMVTDGWGKPEREERKNG